MNAGSPERRACRGAREGVLPRVLLVLFLFCAAAVATDALAINLPPGFTDSEVIGGLTEPIAFEWAPNGDLWVVLKRLGVRIVRGGQIINAGTIPVSIDDEEGITGFTIDPDFATNHWLWISYTDPTATQMRVSRFTVVNDQITAESIVLQHPIIGTAHHAGCLRFDTDGTLYISTGDDTNRSVFSQNTNDLRGKILHINRDGTPAAGNPFLGGGGDPRVWAYGLRHPYRFNFQPGTRTMFIADIGDEDWEELNFGIPGANYGWAVIEGFSVTGFPGYVYPVYTYRHTSPTGNSIIGGDHAEAGDLAPEYLGNYFYGDEAAGWIGRVVLDASNNVVLAENWATGVEHPVDLRFGPGGSLYYAAFFLNSIRKISFVGGANRAPQAIGTATPASGLAPLLVTLNGTGSSDPDQDPLTYTWNPGHGSPANGATIQHSYPAGVYTASLTVTDPGNASSTSPGIRIVSGNRAPTATITAPAAGALYNAGDLIAYSGTGTDPEEGNLGCDQFTWTITFHHLGHVHPHIGPIQGVCGGSFSIPTTGETSASTHYEIRLDVADHGTPLGEVGSLTGSSTISINPRTVVMNLASAPNPNLLLTLDGQLFFAPKAEPGVVGFQRSIGVSSPQTAADGRTYTFASWSDAGAATHGISTPAVNTTYTALFTCNVITEVTNLMVAPAAGGQIALTWDPATDICKATGPVRYHVYEAATSVPTTPPGQFPNDPPFALIGTTQAESLTFTPGAGDRVYLVVAIGTNGQDGPSGHY